MATYTLVERTTSYTLNDAYPDLDVIVLQQQIPSLADFQGNKLDWGKAIAKKMFPNATDSDSPWQVLASDGGHWFLESFEIDDDKNVNMVARLYWKNSENARDFTGTELARWRGVEIEDLPTTEYTITTNVVDFQKAYVS